MYTVKDVEDILNWLVRNKNYKLNVKSWIEKIKRDVKSSKSSGGCIQFNPQILWRYLTDDPLIDCLLIIEGISSVDELLHRATEYYVAGSGIATIDLFA